MRTFFPALLSSALFLPLSLRAHDLRLDRVENGYRLHYGHEDLVDHQGTNSLRIDKFRSGECLDGPKREALSPVQKAGELFFARLRCNIVLIRYHAGHFTKTTTGTLESSKRQTRNALHSWVSFEYIKRIELDRTPEAEWSLPLGEPVEITPLFRGRPEAGGWITLLVTENGKPSPSVPVAVSGETRGATDPIGTIRLRLRPHPSQLFQATVRRPLSSMEADEEIHTATLQFEIKG